jgi:hypothetical protein
MASILCELLNSITDFLRKFSFYYQNLIRKTFFDLNQYYQGNFLDFPVKFIFYCHHFRFLNGFYQNFTPKR